MKITQEVRKFANQQGVKDSQALQKGLEIKAVEFMQSGAQIYQKV